MAQLQLDIETPILCPDCGEEVDGDDVYMVTSDQCTQCYVNEDCPAQCNEEHPAPYVTRDGNEWECPSIGTAYYYLGPENGRGYGAEWIECNRYGDCESVLVDGYYVHQDEAFYCEGCDEYRLSDEYDEDGYCTRHVQTIHGVSLALPRCSTRGCQNTITHFNPMTEAAHCEAHSSDNDELLEAA